MKKILFILLLPLTLFGQSQKISDMTSATSLTGSEYVPIVQSTNKKATVGLLRGWTSLGTAGQLLKVNSGATALEFFTPSYLTTLTNGNGTTANGSAVDLGGVQSGNIDIDPAVAGTYEFRVGYTRPVSRIVGYTDFEVDFRSDNSGYTQGSSLLLQNSNSQIRAYGSGYDRRINFNNSRVILDLGSDATGDTYYRNSSGYLTRLAAGTDGHVLTLASGIPSWAASSGGSGLTVGTSTITSGTNTRVLYNNSGILGEYTVSGSGNVAMTTSPTFTTPILGTPTSGTLTNATGYLFNNLAAATGTGTINNAANAIEWQWNTLGAGTGLKLSSTSTAAASNTQRIFEIALSGANATSTQTTYAAKIANTHTGTSAVNYGLELAASGGTFNRALYISAGDIYMPSTSFIVNSGAQQFSTNATSGAINVFNTIATGSSNLFQVSQTGTATVTSGVYRGIYLSGINFAPSSGSVILRGVHITPTINQTGTASGNINGYTWEPTVTALLGSQHNAFYATAGDLRLDAGNIIASGSTTTQGQIIQNIATTGSDVYRRTVDWAPVTASGSSGNFDFNIFNTDVITNSTCTATITITGVSSDGVKSYAKEMKATFRKPGTSDPVQVGATVDIYEHSNDLTTPTSSVSASTEYLRVSYDSGTGAPTLRWTVFVTTKYSTN